MRKGIQWIIALLLVQLSVPLYAAWESPPLRYGIVADMSYGDHDSRQKLATLSYTSLSGRKISLAAGRGRFISATGVEYTRTLGLAVRTDSLQNIFFSAQGDYWASAQSQVTRSYSVGAGIWFNQLQLTLTPQYRDMRFYFQNKTREIDLNDTAISADARYFTDFGLSATLMGQYHHYSQDLQQFLNPNDLTRTARSRPQNNNARVQFPETTQPALSRLNQARQDKFRSMGESLIHYSYGVVTDWALKDWLFTLGLQQLQSSVADSLDQNVSASVLYRWSEHISVEGGINNILHDEEGGYSNFFSVFLAF